MYSKKYFQIKLAELEAQIQTIKDGAQRIPILEAQADVYRELVDRVDDAAYIVAEELKNMPKVNIVSRDKKRYNNVNVKSSTGYTSIYKRKDSNKFVIQLHRPTEDSKGKKFVYVGSYNTIEAAIIAYNKYIDTNKLDMPKHKFKK